MSTMPALTLWQPFASLCVIPRPNQVMLTPTGRLRSGLHEYHGAPAPFKTIETRSWKAPDSLIGQRIAIHAAKREPERHEWALPYPPWTMWLDEFGKRWLQHYTFTDPNTIDTYQEWLMPLGAVVGTAVLAACVPMVDDTTQTPDGPFVYVDPDFIQVHDRPDDSAPRYLEDERHLGQFEPGRWAWLLTDAVRFTEPIPAIGRQGIWHLESPTTPTRGDQR